MTEELFYIRHMALYLLLAAGISCTSVQAALVDTGAINTTPAIQSGLFDTVEFRGSLRALQSWQRIVSLAPEQLEWLSTTRDKQQLQATGAWQGLIEELRDKPVRQQVLAVNTFFNRWPYRLDRNIWQRNDYWATPLEFLRHSGDCEDYAICKYFALRYLGLKTEQLRIVILHDTIRSITHAVLAVYVKDDILILDNLSNPVFSHHRYQHYLPQYSVNEQHRWMHIKPRKRQCSSQETSTGD